MEEKELFVRSWTIKKKYNCPECSQKRAFGHPEYICKKCGIKFKLKIKF